MHRTIKATEAVRAFSEILNSVKYRHESYTIIRGGKPVAALVPVEASSVQKTLGDLPALIKSLPKLGADIERFMKDIEESIRKQPHIPENTAWE